MKVDPQSTSRPPLRYHGSKWRMAPWVISYLPDHASYIEPYGGGGAVLLRKPRSILEVYNDLDGEVVNFFRVLREHTDEFVRQIELTPFALDEYKLSMLREKCDDPIEWARRFYVRAYMCIHGPTGTNSSGWRRQKKVTRGKGEKQEMTPTPMSFMRTDHLYLIAERLRGVFIENMEALELISRYDNSKALFYLDPPYPMATRSTSWRKSAYSCEMSDDQHIELAELARSLEGFVVISGYDCEMYNDLYYDWQRFELKVRTNSASSAIEILWLNPAATARRTYQDLPLFSGKEIMP